MINIPHSSNPIPDKARAVFFFILTNALLPTKYPFGLLAVPVRLPKGCCVFTCCGGNPAIVLSRDFEIRLSLDPWLCVPAFQQVCLFLNRLLGC
jgi:hypothetical protein